MSKNLIQVHKLGKQFNSQPIFEDLSFDLKQGEFVSLIGPSGCGKTVLLKIIIGLLNKSRGNIDYNFEKNDLVRISMAFQRSPLFPWLDLLENITICMNNRHMASNEKRKLAMAYLKMAHLEKYSDHFPNEISGGMTQKVNVIRCFCSQSELILMDEPFVFLDFIQRTNLQKFTMDIWQQERKTILFVTHNIHEAITLSDRVILMSAQPGRIIAEFPIDISRPRDVEHLREDGKYLSILKSINSQLSEQVAKANESLL